MVSLFVRVTMLVFMLLWNVLSVMRSGWILRAWLLRIFRSLRLVEVIFLSGIGLIVGRMVFGLVL